MLTRLAILRLLEDSTTPPEMKAWLRASTPDAPSLAEIERYFHSDRIGIFPRATDGLAYWAVVPDLIVMSDRPDNKADGYDVGERMLHFIDLEFFHADESLRVYSHDLKGLPALAEVPNDRTDPRYLRSGMLPFRVADCFTRLVGQFRAGRLNDKPGQFPRDEHATKWAGMLAHYAQDNTQPQHATLDYKSTSYFAEARKAPNVHSQLEYMMVDDDLNDHADLRKEYWEAFAEALRTTQDGIATDDPWQSTVEVARSSYTALPLIGSAAMHASGQGGTPQKPEGASGEFDLTKFFHFQGVRDGQAVTVLQMKAHQQALAVTRTVRLWRAAWDQAQRPSEN